MNANHSSSSDRYKHMLYILSTAYIIIIRLFDRSIYVGLTEKIRNARSDKDFRIQGVIISVMCHLLSIEVSNFKLQTPGSDLN